jgi:hypothetical protein
MNTLKEETDENDRIRQNKMNMIKRLMKHINYDYTNNFIINDDEMNNIINNFKTTPTEQRTISRTKLDDYKIIQTVLKKYGFILTQTYKQKREAGKRIKIKNGYIIKHDKELYKCIYLIVKKNGAHKFNNNINKICNEHTEYNKLTEYDGLKQKQQERII